MFMSIASAQASAIADGFLNNIGESKQGTSDMPIVEKVLAEFAKVFITQAQLNLRKANAIDTGALMDLEMEIEHEGNKYTLTVGYPASSAAAKYYDFVNKGVKGIKDSTLAPDSPYRFRKLNPGGPLTQAIEAWISRHAIASRNEDQKFGLTNLQKKRNSVSQLASSEAKQHSIAYAIGASIKRRGLKKTGYFDKAVNDVFGEGFSEALAKAIGADIRLSIRQANNSK